MTPTPQLAQPQVVFFLPHRPIPREAFGLTPKPVLSVDLDNVIRDQIGAIISAVRRRYGVTLQREMFSVWDPPLGELIGISNEEFTTWAWADPMIFANAAPVPGAITTLARLRATHRIVITTSTAWPQLTEPWLKWWHIPYHQVIHTSDKGSVAFDWHVDDSPATLVKLAEAGRRVVRFRLPWNEHLTGLPVLDGWQGAEEVLR